MHDVTKTIKLHAHYRHNGTIFNCMVMDYQGASYYLPCGLNDTINVFTLDTDIYVLNINLNIGYIGFTIYQVSDPYPIKSIFCHVHNVDGA